MSVGTSAPKGCDPYAAFLNFATYPLIKEQKTTGPLSSGTCFPVHGNPVDKPNLWTKVRAAFENARNIYNKIYFYFYGHFTTFVPMTEFRNDIPVPKKKPRKNKYDFTGMKKSSHAWFPGTTHTVLTSFKAWCVRNNKKWLGKTQKWKNEQTGEWGTMIWRIK